MPGNAARKRIVATSVTEPVTSLVTVTRRRTPATTVTRYRRRTPDSVVTGIGGLLIQL